MLQISWPHVRYRGLIDRSLQVYSKSHETPQSYIYLPLLEETGFIPKHRYSYGPEIRAHANRIAEKWGLTHNAMFRTEAKSADWDEDGKRWSVKLEEIRGPQEPKKTFSIHSQFILAVTGNSPFFCKSSF